MNNREQDDDAMMTSLLDTDKVQRYEKYKTEGCSDSTIFNYLFPQSDSKITYVPPYIDDGILEEEKPSWMKTSVDINVLNKEQLVPLLQDELISKFSGLSRASEEELRKLLIFLKKNKEN